MATPVPAAESLTSWGHFLFVLLLLAAVLLGGESRRWRYATESSVACMLGILAGGAGLVFGAPPGMFKWSSNIFFDVCLPPIIFNAGFSMKKKWFFRNFVPITCLGIFGTVFNFFAVTGYVLPLFGLQLALGDCMALAVVFSSTDSVAALQVLDQEATPGLYSLVFGEGVLNDATSIVLLGSIKTIAVGEAVTWGALPRVAVAFLTLFSTSLGIGIATGLLSAVMVRQLYGGRGEAGVGRELLVMGLLALMAYLGCEALDLSGIVACFFAGVTMSHYTYHNLHAEAQVVAGELFQLASSILEVVVFVYTGLDSWDPELWKHSHNGQAALLAFPMMIILGLARAAFVFPVCHFLGQKARAPWAAVWWSGTMRGAVSLALAYNWFAHFRWTKHDPVNATILAMTIVVVLFTTMVAGALNKSVLGRLCPAGTGGAGRGPAGSGDWSAYATLLEGDIGDEGGDSGVEVADDMGSPRLPPEPVGLHKIWRDFDRAWVMPLVGGRNAVPPAGAPA